MSVKWEKQGSNDGKLTFSIDPEKIKKGLDVAFNRVKGSLNVPGFRKGKVSREVFNKMYGEEALYQDALNVLLPEAYAAAVEEAKISPVGQPEIAVESMGEDAEWVLSAKVAVKPEVELGQYFDLEVAPQQTRVLKADIEGRLEQLQQQHAELVLKEDAPAEEGDTVIIDFTGRLDGKEFEGGAGTNYSLVLGSGQFIPGFEEQLIGHKAGETVDVKVTFPEEYHAKELAGKEAVFEVAIHEVKEKEVPALDDEFAKDVDDSVSTLDELKEKIKEQIKEQKVAAAHQAIQEEALTLAVDNATVKDIPGIMIEEDVNSQLNQYLAGMAQQGISPEMYFQLTGSNEEELRKQFEDGAERRVKTNLVLEAIVKAEGINPSDEQVAEEIKELAQAYNMEEAAVRAALSDDMLKHDIAIREVVEKITDTAKQTRKADK